MSWSKKKKEKKFAGINKGEGSADLITNISKQTCGRGDAGRKRVIEFKVFSRQCVYL